MKKLTIKSIVEFRRKSDKSKKRFAEDLKIDKEKDDAEGGGDYWIMCLSAISNAYKADNLDLIKEKIEELQGKIEETDNDQTKDMYQRNMNILYDYEDVDFNPWRFSKDQVFIKKLKIHSPIKINGLFVDVTPHSVFSFNKIDTNEIGAIWFIAKKGGFSKEDLGMFSDILYRYLDRHYSSEYVVNPKYCIAVDLYSRSDVNYHQIQSGEISEALLATINEIKRLM